MIEEQLELPDHENHATASPSSGNTARILISLGGQRHRHFTQLAGFALQDLTVQKEQGRFCVDAAAFWWMAKCVKN